MKTLFRQCIYWMILLLTASVALPLMANDDAEKMIVISGCIKDNESKRPLGSVNITVPGTNIGTETNADGNLY